MRIQLLALFLFASVSGTALAADPLVESYLTAGQLAQGETELTRHLEKRPDDTQARFGLGALQFLRAIEGLGQGLHRYGAMGAESRAARMLPLVRLPVPENPAPEAITYADFRAILERLVVDLQKAETTLQGVHDPAVKLPLHFALIRLDLNADGKAEDDETLWRIYAELNRGAGLDPQQAGKAADDFVIAFDQGDVHWLRGYCHLLSALAEMMLAYDEQALFDVVAPSIFAKPAGAIPAPLLPASAQQFEADIADAIAIIHLANFPVHDAERLRSAHRHLQAVIEQSRQSWQAIEAETDDEREWVPNERQQGVIPGIRVTRPIIDGWRQFLDEADQLLAGKKLVPHWRGVQGSGVNLRRVFLEPQRFDLVLWVHGAAAGPYLEQGETTSRETWQRLAQLFGGNFIGFAIWFN
ncbi:MAG: hypothetical protein U0836_23900 [Pirellulales bacterium]